MLYTKTGPCKWKMATRKGRERKKGGETGLSCRCKLTLVCTLKRSKLTITVEYQSNHRPRSPAPQLPRSFRLFVFSAYAMQRKTCTGKHDGEKEDLFLVGIQGPSRTSMFCLLRYVYIRNTHAPVSKSALTPEMLLIVQIQLCPLASACVS